MPDIGKRAVAALVATAGRHVIPLLYFGYLLSFIDRIVFGIVMALMEETVPDGRDARIVNANLSEYLVPVNADVPDIDVIFVHEDDPYVNPLGVKGIGEIGITGAAAAVANAVYHATGVRVRDLPIRLDKLV